MLLKKYFAQILGKQDQLELLSLVAKNTDNAVIITDPDGRILWVNEGFERISEYTLEEVQGRKPGHVLQGQDTDPDTVAYLRAQIMARQPATTEILNYSKTGRPYWLELRITPVFSAKGELTHFVAIELDITERKADEQWLKQLSLLARETDNAVILSSAEGLVEWVNEGFTRISGYTLEEVKGRKPGHLLQGPNTDPKAVANIRAALAAGQPINQEILNYHKNGTPYWLELRITPLLDDKGRLRNFIAIEMDVTDRKRAEMELLETNEELRAIEEELRQNQDELLAINEKLEQQNRDMEASNRRLLEQEAELTKLSLVARQTDNAVIIASAEGLVEWVNEGFEKISGYTLDEVRGRKPGHILQGPATSPEAVQRIRHMLSQKVSFSQEILNYNKNGKPYWLDLRITPILDAVGNVVRFIAIESDITDSKEKQLAIAESIDYAVRIQQAFLPGTEAFQQVFGQSFVHYAPRDVVSGDFYWLHRTARHTYVASVDCTGHGVPGAMMSMLGYQALSQIATQNPDIEPGLLLERLDAQVRASLQQDRETQMADGMDLMLMRLDHSTHTLHYAAAGQTGYLLRKGDIVQLEGERHSIGAKYFQGDTIRFATHSLQCAPGDRLFLFSDGVTDQFNPLGKKLGRTRLATLLADSVQQSLAEQQSLLVAELKAWQGTTAQTDDILLMGLEL